MKTKGGKRKGAGRKPAPYITKTISFRVREEWADVIKTLVKAEIKHLTNTPKLADVRAEIKQCFLNYYKDDSMPIVEVEEEINNIVKRALLSQIEDVSEYLPPKIYTQNVIKVKCYYGSVK